MHFFYLIQQSAPHIYHSALPLSPKSSTFRSGILQDKTLFAELPECRDTWGAIIRTIKANSGNFTCMTTFSHRVAAAIDDGTVGIYDSVTGALRLSLSPADPVRAINGSPDGSMLFCAHQGPSITVWDIQTGGLIHTFVLEDQVEDIAVSSTGCSIACGLSDGTVKIWGVANNTEVAAFKSGSPLTHICWLEPGEQLAIANKKSVRVWDVIVRKVLRVFTVQGSVHGLVFAQRLNKFAILATSGVGSTITVVDPRTGTLFTDATTKRLSCLAISQTTKELVCAADNPGLELFNIALREWRQFHHLATITSVSTLSSGFVVANVPGSGIQFLSPDEVYTPQQQPTISVVAVYALDKGDILTVISRDRTTLLEFATMSPLLTIPTQTRATSTRRPQILCASLRHRIAVCCHQHDISTHLELWRLGDEAPAWTFRVPGARRPVGGISPSGSRLAVLDNNDSRTHVWMFDTKNGSCRAVEPIGGHWPGHPLEIKFKSEDEFYSQHESYRIPFTISSSGANTYSITRCGPLPAAEQPQRYYDVDEAREWVVRSSKRICWIPPGYIGSHEHSYCWIGNTLFMAGQDEVVRKLTFREQT